MSLLSVSHLRKSFGGAVALRDASLDLRAGETLALMGENGAGKSTLIKILAGAVAPDGGSIQLDGEPATLRDPPRRIGAGSASSIRNSTSCQASAPPRTSSWAGVTRAALGLSIGGRSMRWQVRR